MSGARRLIHLLLEVPATALHRFGALALLPILTAVVAVDVFMRYFLHDPLIWSQDASTILLLLFFAASLPITTVRDGHIRTETLYERFGVRTRAVIDIFSRLAAVVFFGFVAQYQFYEVPGMRMRGEGAQMMTLPYWPVALFVAIVSAYVMLILVLQCIHSLDQIVSGRENP